MEELESQIAKIQLGRTKGANSYVHITAEKAGGSNAELYVVAELPLFNPAAASSCEKICLAIASTLKRAYRLPPTPGTFENALGQVNEELGKLASLGQTHWVDKLSCIVGVKEGRNFIIATCGKVAAFLFRNQEFTDISCGSAISNPLKPFENYAAGKIRLGDLMILSTPQLLNYLSMDRLKNILSGAEFLTATQTIIEILKENAGPEVAFGTILNLQVPPGQTADEEIDLEAYVVEKPAGQPSLLRKSWTYLQALLAAKEVKRTPKVNLPKVSFAQRLRTFGGSTRNWVAKSRNLAGLVGRGVVAGGRAFSFRRFKEYSPQKKFFFISAAVMLLVVVVNIFIMVYLRKNRASQEAAAGRLKEAQVLLTNAQSAMLYNDAAATVSYLAEAKSKMPAENDSLNSDNKNLYQQVSSQLAELQQKLEKNVEAKVTDLGGLGQADNLIKLPNYVGVQAGQQIVSFAKQTGKIEDGALKAPQSIGAAVATAKNAAVIYSDGKLFVWDYSLGKFGNSFESSVPAKEAQAGLAFYSTNSRVYTVNKQVGQITSFSVTNDALSKPVAAIKDNALSNALDLAIDGNIYVLTDTGINKYLAGKPADFKMPFLVTPYSGSGKIYTDKDAKNIYLLDAGNNRILIIDKRGSLVGTIKAKEFTKLKDFQVDEKNKTIYVLNDSSLLKVVLP